VKWVGCGDEENTDQAKETLVGCQTLIDEYWAEMRSSEKIFVPGKKRNAPETGEKKSQYYFLKLKNGGKMIRKKKTFDIQL